ncbi:hypothetical protein N9333_03880 [Gammaproteobacteria bacterium]|nr:hypothetical protein [Gammaproteobacteria bacterium]
MNFIQPSKIFLIAFLPFIFGGLLNIYYLNDFLSFFCTLTFLFFGYLYLYSHLTTKESKLYFLIFSSISILLSITLSYVFLSIEGFRSFDEIQRFATTEEHTSDLVAMGPVVELFFDLIEGEGLKSALTYNWMGGYYNSYLSVFKMTFSSLALPGIGYYAFSIISWWFIVLFLSICAMIYKSNLNHQNESSPKYFLCFFIPWLIAPFALPNDREIIGIVLLGIIGMGFLSREKLSFISILTIVLCTIMLVFQRYAYAAFVPIILLLLLYNFFLVQNNKTLFPKIYFTNNLKVLFSIIILISMLSVVSFLLPAISLLAILDTNFNDRVDAAMTGGADAWTSLSTGVPLIDLPLKIFFLILTPFPFYQMYRGEYGWELTAVRLIPLNVLPIYMFGKLYITIFLVLESFRHNFTKLLFPIIGMLFIAAVVVSDRAGPAYLIPAYACFILWMLSRGVSQINFQKTFPYYLMVLFGTHFLYWIVYWKI